MLLARIAIVMCLIQGAAICDDVSPPRPFMTASGATATPVVRISPTSDSTWYSLDLYVEVRGTLELTNPFLHTRGFDCWQLRFVGPDEAWFPVKLGRDNTISTVGPSEFDDGAIVGRRFWIRINPEVSSEKSSRRLQFTLMEGAILALDHQWPIPSKVDYGIVVAASETTELPLSFEYVTSECPKSLREGPHPLDLSLIARSSSRAVCSAIFCNVSGASITLSDPFFRHTRHWFTGKATLRRRGNEKPIDDDLLTPAWNPLPPWIGVMESVPPNAVFGGNLFSRREGILHEDGQYEIEFVVDERFVAPQTAEQHARRDASDLKELVRSKCEFQVERQGESVTP